MATNPNPSKLEELTCRRIGIDFDESDADGKFNEQSASPLFAVLPRELRDLIWAYATAPFEDPTAKFEENAYYYRPGHTAHLRSSTSLLRTCRRVWLEANALPMLQAEHSFYYHRPAPDKRDPAWMAQLTDHNRQNFGLLHLYVQMYAIEGLTAGAGQLRAYFLKTLPAPGDFQPRVLHVTLRHTDFYWWESDAELRLKDSWVAALLNSPDLRSTYLFKLELETLDYKVDQLMPIIERIKKIESQAFETHIVDGKPTKTQFVLSDHQTTYKWEGPANINNEKHNPYEGKTKLSYHVVTLTWKLHFPAHPRAFVPDLRKAPRVAVLSADVRHQPEHQLNLLYNPMISDYPVRTWRPRRPGRQRANAQAQLERLRWVQSRVGEVSTRLAETVEDVRRRSFEAYRGAIVARECEERWKRNRSLLKFVD